MKKIPFLAQAGFSLIELVIVLIVLGILLAIVVPKYFNASTDASVAATTTVAAALNAASANNALLSKVGDSTAVTVTNCTHVANALPGSNPLPAGYTITSLAIASGAKVTCTVTANSTGATATFIGRGT